MESKILIWYWCQAIKRKDNDKKTVPLPIYLQFEKNILCQKFESVIRDFRFRINIRFFNLLIFQHTKKSKFPSNFATRWSISATSPDSLFKFYDIHNFELFCIFIWSTLGQRKEEIVQFVLGRNWKHWIQESCHHLPQKIEWDKIKQTKYIQI